MGQGTVLSCSVVTLRTAPSDLANCTSQQMECWRLPKGSAGKTAPRHRAFAAPRKEAVPGMGSWCSERGKGTESPQGVAMGWVNRMRSGPNSEKTRKAKPRKPKSCPERGGVSAPQTPHVAALSCTPRFRWPVLQRPFPERKEPTSIFCYFLESHKNPINVSTATPP